MGSIVRNNILRFGNLFSIILAVFLFDIILLGSGAWSDNLLGINIRKVLFVLLYLMAGFSAFKKGINKNLLILTFISTMFSSWYVLFMPMVSGIPFKNAITDWMPLMGLMLAPLLAGLEIRHNFWGGLRGGVQLLCLLQAVIHIVIWWLGKSSSGLLEVFRLFMETYLRSQVEGNIDNIIMSETPDGGFRFLYPSSLLLIIGVYFSMAELLSSTKKLRSIVKLVIFCIALYTTWTRAFYLLPALAYIFYFSYGLILKKDNRFQSVYSSYLLFIVLFLIFQLFGVMSSKILTQLGLASPESDEARTIQVSSISDTIFNSPIFGIGFGGHADYIRSTAAPWTYEMAFYALFMKVGVLGFILICVMLCFGLKSFINSNTLRTNRSLVKNWLAFSTASMLIFGSNPFLFSLAGVGVAVILFMELAWISKGEK